MRNCAVSMDQIQEYRCPLSPVGETPLSPAYSHSECFCHGHILQGGAVVHLIEHACLQCKMGRVCTFETIPLAPLPPGELNQAQLNRNITN